MDEKDCYLAFSVMPGIGPGKFKVLLERFGTAKKAWNAHSKDLQDLLGKSLTEKFVKFREGFPLDAYLRELRTKNVDFLTLFDSDYPESLKKIEKAPFVLFLKGNKKLLGKDKFAIVGARKTTQYGRDITEFFAHTLTQEFIIVSGLAMGVDAVSHQATLDSGGKTIAVLGCGVDCCTPRENEKLYYEILKKDGLIVSELPLSHPPTKGSFPQRNRIIAALSKGILVTEGTEDSGSLITADYAFKFGVKVFAVPGPINSGMSKGPYKLIKKGAKLVTNPSEVLEGFGLKAEQKIKEKKIKGDSKNEQKVLNLLDGEGLGFDQILREVRLESSELASLLSIMEIKGYIKNSDGIYSLF